MTDFVYLVELHDRDAAIDMYDTWTVATEKGARASIYADILRVISEYGSGEFNSEFCKEIIETIKKDQFSKVLEMSQDSTGCFYDYHGKEVNTEEEFTNAVNSLLSNIENPTG